MSAWKVWSATRADAETLAALEAEAFGARSWGVNSVKASFAAPGVKVMLGGKAAGAAEGFALWRDLGEEAELLTIGVVPAARRTGLGKALLDAIIGAARAAGAENIYLEVDDRNMAAVGLYRSAGFRPLGVRKHYYRDGGDAAVMSCSL